MFLFGRAGRRSVRFTNVLPIVLLMCCSRFVARYARCADSRKTCMSSTNANNEDNAKRPKILLTDRAMQINPESNTSKQNNPKQAKKQYKQWRQSKTIQEIVQIKQNLPRALDPLVPLVQGFHLVHWSHWQYCTGCLLYNCCIGKTLITKYIQTSSSTPGI